MTDDPDILGRIDDTLEQWDEWDGRSPDAARWVGGPDESEWPKGPTLEESWRIIMDEVRRWICCDAGQVSWPQPCPWHGSQVPR